LKRFMLGLAAGYGIVAANVLYTALSIPLALNFLGKEQLALWVLIQQMGGFLLLLELGASSASARMIADHADQPRGVEYGKIFWGSALVFFCQGALILGLGLAFSFFAGEIFHIPLNFSRPFQGALGLMTCFTALTIILRIAAIPLWANQRMDILNLSGILSLLLGLLTLYGFLRLGFGLYSFPISMLPGILVSFFLQYYVCTKHRLYPAFGLGFLYDPALLRSVLKFGMNVFLCNLGSQMVTSAPLLVAARFLRLETVADYAVSAKFYVFLQGLFQKITQNASPGLTDLYVRGEKRACLKNFSLILFLSGLTGALGAFLLASGFAPLIHWWTEGRVSLPAYVGFGFGFLLFFSSLAFCLFELFAVERNLHQVRFWKIEEGLLVAATCYLLGSVAGVLGLVGGSILGSFFFLGRTLLHPPAVCPRENFAMLRPLVGIFVALYCVYLAVCELGLRQGLWAFSTGVFLVSVFVFLVRRTCAPELRRDFSGLMRKFFPVKT